MASTPPEGKGRSRRASARITRGAQGGGSSMGRGPSRRNRANRQGKRCCASEMVGELSILVQAGGAVEPHPTFKRRQLPAALPSGPTRRNGFTSLTPHRGRH